MAERSLAALVKLPLTSLRYGLSAKLNKVGKFDWSQPVKEAELEQLTEVLDEANIDPGQELDFKDRKFRLERAMQGAEPISTALQHFIHHLESLLASGNLDDAETAYVQELAHQWQSSIFSEWELRRLIDDLRATTRDRSFENEILNVKAAMEKGRAPHKIDLDTPQKQMLWGGHLLYAICNPDTMSTWQRRKGTLDLAQTALWRQTIQSHQVQYLRALFGAHIFNLLRNNEILVGWGNPGSWFAFHLSPAPGTITLDLLYSMVVGFDHARSCAVHEISHAVQSKGLPQSIRDIQQKLRDIETRAQLGLAQPGELQDRGRMEKEIALRKHLLNAAEDNTVNHFTVQIGKLFGQDYGYSLNYFYTAMGDVGRRYTEDFDPYLEDSPENRFANLNYIISRYFLIQNGLFEDTEEAWRSIKAKPEWIVGRNRRNPEETLNPVASFQQLKEILEEITHQYPPLRDMASGPEYYESQAVEYSKYRFALITEVWDLYATDLCEQILDKSEDQKDEDDEDPFDKFQNKLDQELPPQQDKDDKEDNEDNQTPPSSQDDDSSKQTDDQDPTEPPPDEQGEADSEDSPTDDSGDEEQSEDDGSDSDNADTSNSDSDPQSGDSQQQPPPQPPEEKPKDEQEDEEDQSDDQEPEEIPEPPPQQDDEAEDDEEMPAPEPEPEPEPEAHEEEGAEEDIHQTDDEGQQEEQQEVAFDDSQEDAAPEEGEGEGEDMNQPDLEEEGELPEPEELEIPEEQLVAEEVEAPEIEEPEERDMEDDEEMREMPNQDGSGKGGDGSKHDVLQSDFFPDSPLASLGDLQAALREAGQAPEPERRERPQPEPRDFGAEIPKMDVPKALSLDELAQGSWEDFAKRVSMHAPIISLMAEALKKLKNAQLKLIYKISRKHTLTPLGGDLRRYDGRRAQKLMEKLAANETFDKDDLNLFLKDRKVAAITRPTRVILIDGSRSMSMGSSPYPMDKAIQEAIIDYKASEIAGYDTYILMFGPDHPLVLAKPGDNPTVIGNNIEKVRGGLNTMTQVAPGILKTIELVANRKKFKEPYVGFTNFVFYSDGDIDDPRQTQLLIEQIFHYAPKSTFDFVLITTKQMTPMDQLVARLRFNNPRHDIGVVRGDAARKFPMALMSTYKLTNRLRSSANGFADPSFVRSAQFRRLLRHLTT